MMEKVLSYLDGLGIKYDLLRHEPVVTTEESFRVITVPDCLSCKSLYVKDKKSADCFMAVLTSDKRADMRKLAGYVGRVKFEFVSEEKLFIDLGVRRGSVSPFAFLNVKEQNIPLIIDADIWNGKRVKFHPCDNTATVVLSVADMKKFLFSLGTEIIVADCT